MLEHVITRHAEVRMQQRGLRNSDLTFLLEVATQVAPDAYLLTRADAEREIAQRKREIQRLERLRGQKVVVLVDALAGTLATTVVRFPATGPAGRFPVNRSAAAGILDECHATVRVQLSKPLRQSQLDTKSRRVSVLTSVTLKADAVPGLKRSPQATAINSNAIGAGVAMKDEHPIQSTSIRLRDLLDVAVAIHVGLPTEVIELVVGCDSSRDQDQRGQDGKNSLHWDPQAVVNTGVALQPPQSSRKKPRRHMPAGLHDISFTLSRSKQVNQRDQQHRLGRRGIPKTTRHHPVPRARITVKLLQQARQRVLGILVVTGRHVVGC